MKTLGLNFLTEYGNMYSGAPVPARMVVFPELGVRVGHNFTKEFDPISRIGSHLKAMNLSGVHKCHTESQHYKWEVFFQNGNPVNWRFQGQEHHQNEGWRIKNAPKP